MPETDSINADTYKSVVAETKETLKPTTMVLTGIPGHTDSQVIVLPEGMRIERTAPFLESRPSRPERYEGTAVLADLDSFIAHVLLYKDSNSRIFAKTDPKAPSLTAILDDHEAKWATCYDGGVDTGNMVYQDESAPRFGVHRSHYAFPVSDEWTAWQNSNAKSMTQVDFAAFLEDRALDLLPPPILDSVDLPESDKVLKRLTDLLRGRWAGPETMMDLSRGLSVHERSKVVSATNLSSGEGAIVFENEHETMNSANERVAVPNLFCVGIPVFKDGPAYRIAVRLRYRKQGSSLSWFYELYQDDKTFKHALDEALDTAGAMTGLTVLRGVPEERRPEAACTFPAAR